MKLFLSWSGKRSKAVAELWRDWLPQMIQAVEPWISAGDIEKGRSWSPAIANELERSRVGIFCLTRENLNSDWLHFEAGALSKTKDAHVCTFLLGISPSDVQQPLAQFQHTGFSQDEVFKLIKTINKRVANEGERSLPDEPLTKLFTKLWPEFERDLNEVLNREAENEQPVRSEREMIQEILEITRTQQQRLLLQNAVLKPIYDANKQGKKPAFVDGEEWDAITAALFRNSSQVESLVKAVENMIRGPRPPAAKPITPYPAEDFDDSDPFADDGKPQPLYPAEDFDDSDPFADDSKPQPLYPAEDFDDSDPFADD